MSIRIVAIMLVLGCLTSCNAENNTNVAVKPNVLMIVLDDLGKEWVSIYDGIDVGTPHLDLLAQRGMVFDNAYVNPQCTPTRVSLLTGQYPFRHGWINHWDTPRWGHGYFDWRRNYSIARLMKSAGYATAAAGKWQVNDFRITPDAMQKHGFDSYLMWTGYETGKPASAERYWHPYLHSADGSRTYRDAFGADLFTQFLIEFIEKNKETPWFAYYPMALPHLPLTTTPAAPDANGDVAQYEAMIQYADAMLGQLVAEIDRLGEREDTIIVWMTDNGSDPQLTGYRNGRDIQGAKGYTVEAGVNVPLVVSGPNIPVGGRTDALVDITDFLPTFADLAGVEVPDDYRYDGQSFADLIDGKAAGSDRSWILAMGGQNNAAVSEQGVENQYIYRDRVIRDKNYKLYVSSSPNREPEKLFNLSEDPNEENNLIASDDPAAKAALDRLSAIVSTFPTEDADPIYTRRAANDWDVDVSVESQSWKK
jgi:arylsulfatase A-like enzyme